MEITWYGHSCFRLTERSMATVVTDPFDNKITGYDQLKLRADIVTVSHDAPGHNNAQAVKGKSHVITGPGEFEIGGVFITGVQTNHVSKKQPEEARNTLYMFDYDGINIVHLGDMGRVPSQTEVEALGTVHIALVPVGGGTSLNAAKAVEVISLLEPGIVIPMHYGTSASSLKLAPVDKFLKEMGVGELEPQPSLKVTRTTVPEETKVVLLSYARS